MLIRTFKLSTCTAILALLCFSLPAFAEDAKTAKVLRHVGDCTKKSGVDRARCERHERMAEKCAAHKGEAHFACDREFLLKNPLNCTTLQSTEVAACQVEIAAFKICEPEKGRKFMQCVRNSTGASPVGH